MLGMDLLETAYAGSLQVSHISRICAAVDEEEAEGGGSVWRLPTTWKTLVSQLFRKPLLMLGHFAKVGVCRRELANWEMGFGSVA